MSEPIIFPKHKSSDLQDNLKNSPKKVKIRFLIFVLLWFISYIICIISAFFWKWFIIPAVSFVSLFLLIYFIALDSYRIKFLYVLYVLWCLFIIETIAIIIISGFSRYLILELILFNLSIWTLLFLLSWQLNNRTTFSPFSYFTQW